MPDNIYAEEENRAGRAEARLVRALIRGETTLDGANEYLETNTVELETAFSALIKRRKTHPQAFNQRPSDPAEAAIWDARYLMKLLTGELPND